MMKDSLRAMFHNQEALAHEAETMSIFNVVREGDCFGLTWGDVSMNFVLQTRDQLSDLADKINEALNGPVKNKAC